MQNKINIIIKISTFILGLTIVVNAFQLDSLTVDASFPKEWGAITFAVDKNQIIVKDNYKNSVLFYTLEGEYIAADSTGYCKNGMKIVSLGSGDRLVYFSGMVIAAENSKGRIFYVNFEKSGYIIKSNRSFIYDGKRLLVRLSNDSLISIPSPGNNCEDNLSRIESHEQTMEYLQRNEAGSAIEFDDFGDSYITINGVLQSFSFQKFARFYHVDRSLLNDKMNNTLGFKGMQVVPAAMTKLGVDLTGKWYWNYRDDAIIVFDDSGKLIDVIKIPEMSSIVVPSVGPDGTIYLLSFDKETFVVQIVDWEEK